MFKNHIREYRARHYLSQEKLAKIVGVRRETILHLEKGEGNPTLKLASDIAKVFKVKIDDLFIFDEEQKNEEFVRDYD